MLALRITLRQCTTDADSSPVLSIWIAHGVRILTGDEPAAVVHIERQLKPDLRNQT